jgi:alkanesulfonate monooxygenase SsuD/methylene tetrahydromethanopterin reductase-like flavin-dependent oxidoreductase (luciferase family)
MQPVVASLGRGAEGFTQRVLYGSPADIIGQLDQYVARGLDKFVLWPVVEPEAWAGQVEMIGREIATHYARAAQAA